ncbi:MAG TPA: rhodanese-like domain-containing protein [Ferruginibacter sp.]|nr:rhodanese-like domain-containing protein [Ferruginibacter sp.]
MMKKVDMKSIDAASLKKMIEKGEEFYLIDVREPWEHDEKNIGGQLFPLGEILKHVNEIPSDKKVVIYCKKGVRSIIAIQKLQQKFSFDNLYNLSGGIDAWPFEE